MAKILDLVENSSSKKARAENFITKFARYYTPAVVIAAVLLAVVPPLFLPGFPFGEWVHQSSDVLSHLLSLRAGDFHSSVASLEESAARPSRACW